MSDETHWVLVPNNPTDPPRELKPEEIVEHFDLYCDNTYLVPGRVWRDYQSAVARAAVAREDLQTFNRPVLVPVGTRPPAKKGA